MAGQWSAEMDSALVLHINSLSRKLAVATALLHPHEIHISEEVLTNEMFTCLQGLMIWQNVLYHLFSYCTTVYNYPKCFLFEDEHNIYVLGKL
jgi:hypothetical protein